MESNFPLDMSKHQALAMFIEECELRKSDDIQKMYDEYYLNNNGYVEEVVQLTVLNNFRFEPSEENLEKYRHLIWKYRQDPEVRDKIFFMKHNIMREGDLVIGDQAPDVPLLDTGGHISGTLFDFTDKPLVVLGGSLT